MPYTQLPHGDRMYNVLNRYCQSRDERRAGIQLWRYVTNRFTHSGQDLAEYDLILLQQALVWRINECRALAQMVDAQTTSTDSLSAIEGEKGYAEGPSREPPGSTEGPSRDLQRATEGFNKFTERFRKVMKELLAQIRAQQPDQELGLADILAPIIEKGKYILEQSIEPCDVDTPPPMLNLGFQSSSALPRNDAPE